MFSSSRPCIGLFLWCVLIGNNLSVQSLKSESKYRSTVRTSHESRTSVSTSTVALSNMNSVHVSEASSELKRVSEHETCKKRKTEKSFKWMINECQTTTSVSPTKRRKVTPDEQTKRNILELYNGMFFSQPFAESLERRRQAARSRSRVRIQRSLDIEHDGNICCPSVSVLEAAPDQMLNSFLQTRDVVHFEAEGLYQYINKGYCVNPSEQSCSGTCIPETRIVYLLVWKDPLPTNSSVLPMTFEPFDIPSFCSCKNISP